MAALLSFGSMAALTEGDSALSLWASSSLGTFRTGGGGVGGGGGVHLHVRFVVNLSRKIGSLSLFFSFFFFIFSGQWSN